MKKLIAITTLLCTGALSSAWPIWGLTGSPTPDGALDSTTEARVEADEERGIVQQVFCLRGFAKDDCEGVVDPGAVAVTSCDFEECRTISVTDAVYSASLRRHDGECVDPTGTCIGRCDEFPEARLTLKFDYMVRLGPCCRYRGCWSGDWELVTEDGRVYTGTASGTIGIGTNRDSPCLVAHDACEKCYDVDVYDEANLRVGFEGSFQGRDQVGNQLCFTSDGHWIVSSLVINPFGQPFRVFNRFGGVWKTICN